MRTGLGISFFLHALVLISLIFLGNTSERHHPITSIEMVSLLNPQKSQRQRVKGTKTVAPKTSDQLTKKPKQEKASEKLGNDKQEAPEIVGGSQDPQLLAVASYAQELQSFIEKNRYYPRRAMVMEQTGTVKVRLKINAQGEFVSVEVIESSEYDLLNRAAKDLITGLRSFKPLPKAYRGNGEFIVPVRYQLGVGI